VTFSDAAARELRERLEGHVPAARDVVWCGTFHGFGSRLLRAYGSRVGVAEDFVVANAQDASGIREQVIAEHHTFTNNQLRDQIDRLKRRGIYPSDGNISDPELAAAYAEYTRQLRAANMLDFSDLVALAHRLLSQHPDILEIARNKFRYVVADEFQDTDPIQLELITLAAQSQAGSLVVADDDQAIYEWRGARRANVYEIANRLQSSVVVLAENYRSGRVIVDAASAVIGNDSARNAKTLKALIDGGRIHGASFQTPEDEAAAIVQVVEQHIDAGVLAHEIAIISRAAYRNDAIAVALKQLSVPWFDRSQLDHHDSWEAFAILGLITLTTNRDDSDALGLLVRAMDQSGIVDDGYDAAIALRSSLGPVSIATSVADVHGIRDRSGFDRLLGRPQQASERRRLQQNIADLDRDFEAQLKGGAQLLRAVSCFLGKGTVQFCSGHAVKGREFDIVLMMGLEDDVLPGYRSHNDPEALSQERRVFYVSMTRARHEVRLSYARTRMWKGRPQSKSGSRFLSELPTGSIQGW
jgi:DNA helicase-2/ATP-dependent DNA helicase PcrA